MKISASTSQHQHRHWRWHQHRHCKFFFAFRSFLWSKTSMVKSFSTTFVNLPGSVCCYLEQLFSREVVSACFWRKKLRHGRYLRSFKNTQGWKLQLVCLCILIRNHIRDQFLEIFSFLEKSQNSFKKFR